MGKHDRSGQQLRSHATRGGTSPSPIKRGIIYGYENINAETKYASGSQNQNVSTTYL